MKHFRIAIDCFLTISLILFFVLVTLSAAEITGKVTALRENDVKVEYTTSTRIAPAAGDKVSFSTEIEGFKVDAGAGTVKERGAGFVWVAVTESSPDVGYTAKIEASGKHGDAKSGISMQKAADSCGLEDIPI